MSGKKLFSFWRQSPHPNQCSVSSALPWPWLLLHSPLSDDLTVMMVSHLVSDLLLLSCVFALMVLPEYTHTPLTHTHTYMCTQKHYVSTRSPFVYSPSATTLNFPLSCFLCPCEIWGECGYPGHPQWQPFASRTSEQMRWVHVPTWYKLSSFNQPWQSITRRIWPKWAEKFCTL